MEWFTDEQKEINRIQGLVLKEIYGISSKPVFKGGTALQIVYGLDRFSEDLDFDIDINEISAIDEALENLDSKIGIENNWESEISKSTAMYVFMLRFYSALLGKGIDLKIDAVFEKTELEPKKKILNMDGRAVTLIAMDEKEILAEKVNAIMDPKRNQPRDLYDLKFLLDSGVDIDLHLIYLKADSKAFGKHDKYSLGKFSDRVEKLRSKWQELGPYVNALPDFDAVKESVLSRFKLMG